MGGLGEGTACRLQRITVRVYIIQILDWISIERMDSLEGFLGGRVIRPTGSFIGLAMTMGVQGSGEEWESDRKMDDKKLRQGDLWAEEWRC